MVINGNEREERIPPKLVPFASFAMGGVVVRLGRDTFGSCNEGLARAIELLLNGNRIGGVQLQEWAFAITQCWLEWDSRSGYPGGG